MPTKTLQGPCAHCGRPISYPAEMVGTSTTCPYCGKVTDLLLATPPSEPSISRRMIVWVSLVVLILAGGLVATGIAFRRAKQLAAGRTERAAAQQAVTALQEAGSAFVFSTNGFQVSRIVVSRAPGRPFAEGVGLVSNTLAQTRTGVLLRIEFTDRSGRLLGAVTDATPSVGPNEVWTFRVPAFDTNAAAARAVNVTAKE